MPGPTVEKAIFQAAILITDAGQRSKYLDAACHGDGALRSRIEDLLSAGEDEGFMRDRAVESLIAADRPQQQATTIAETKTSERIDKYKLLQKIGEGGFGVVYMAEQELPVRRRVALKVIKLGMDTRQVIARFEAERQALAMMDHPNIAKVLDAGATETGRPYFVMELVRGVPITQFCDENNLSTEERLSIFADVCGAIQHAHQKGIIHRDIKPTNVMITMHDDRAAPKVIDFGVAKAIEHRLTEKTLFTEYAQMIGTPAYMSPEQAQMTGPDVDTRSDVYSLGVLLYELLVGRPPFDPKELRSCGYEEMCRRIREEEPPKPSTRLSTLTEVEVTAVGRARHADGARLSKLLRGELDWIVMKALEKDRRRRYETASSLAADVQRFLNGEPVAAVAPSPFYLMQKFFGRNRIAVLTGGAFALMLILGIVLSTWQAHVANTERRLAQRNEYCAELRLAQHAVSNGNIDYALKIVERHVPKPDEPDLRGFEWRWLWEQTHRERFVIDAHGDAVYDAEISPDGGLLATAARKGMLRFWDLREQKEVGRHRLTNPGNHPRVSFSPDGQRLAVLDAGAIDVWTVNVASQSKVKSLPGATAELLCLAFGPDGSVVAGRDDGALLIWDNATPELPRSIPAHNERIVSIAFSADGARLATAGPDGYVKVWDFAALERSGEPVVTLNGSIEWDQHVALSPDGIMVAATSTFGPIKVWDVNTPNSFINLSSEAAEPVHRLVFSPDGNVLAAAMALGSIKMFDTSDWREITTYEHRGHQLNTVAFSPNSNLLISAGDSGRIMAWEAQPSPNPEVLGGHPSFVGRIAFSPDSHTLLVACVDGSVALWNVDTRDKWSIGGVGTLPSGMPRGEYQQEFYAFSPSGERLAISAPQQETEHFHMVHIYDIERQERVTHDGLKHNSAIYSLAYSPDGRFLAVGCYGKVYLWDLTTQDQDSVELMVDRRALCLAFAPDSTVLACEDYGAGIKLFDLETFEQFKNLPEFNTPMGDHGSLDFSPDGEILAAAGYDGKVLLWDTKTWTPKDPLLGHFGPLLTVSFAPDGKRLASAGLDGETRLWSIDDGREVATFPGMAVGFSPDGSALAVGGLFKLPLGASELSSTVRLYRAPTFDEVNRTLQTNISDK